MPAYKTEADFAKLNFPQAPSITVPPPGPQAQALLARQAKVDSNALAYPHMIPLAPAEGLGATVKDADGNYYIDLSGGIGVLNLGHSHPDVVAAIKAQADQFVHGLDFPAEARVRLSEKLVQIAPGNMRGRSRVFLCGPTGSDAVEAGVKLAKMHSVKPGVISFEGGWHGVSGTGLAATGKRGVRQNCLPVMPEVYIVPYAYCYRCRFGLTYPSCGLQCAKFLEHVVRDPDSLATNPGCILIEPIQGEGGIVVPPEGYLQEVRRICDQYGLILIMDEIQTGFGRSGAMFASELWGVTPDIMLVSKTMGGGLPLAAVVIQEQFDTWGPGAHVGTFRGNLLSCASGLAAVQTIERDGLVDRSRKLGQAALERLRVIGQDSRFIGEVRGRGLFIGMEFVKDKQSKEPAPDILQEVVARCFQKGCMVWKSGRWNNVGRMMPALVITEALLMQSIDIFARELKALEQGYKG
ncbi:MAG: aspartate aminotransferase family protein [Desulfarculus sp.]|jgi:diaminobutyrate-2-oxoglutarate transaminase|nr:MAG: aspartate aminotransferase family protein [Desulfarculus sp.]